MDKIKDMIEEAIKELKSRKEKGWYSHTIKALEKLSREYGSEKEEYHYSGREQSESVKK